MTVLLADMGGTATRLALLHREGGLRSAARWDNDDHAGPGPLLVRYVRECGDPPLRGACVAVAGPVGPEELRLTNRDWAFDRAALAASLGLPQAMLQVVNDLTALALALPGLTEGQAEDLRPGPAAPGNGQALVANFGTGFNVGLVTRSGGGAVAFEAELGNAALPVSVAGELGDLAPRFSSVEALFSGPGLSWLHAARTGAAPVPAQDLVAADAGAAEARETVALMARLMGVFAREMVAAYLPRAGLYLAGSMARGVMQGPARAEFLRALGAPGPLSALAAGIPVRLITDDAAALGGLARLARGPQ